MKFSLYNIIVIIILINITYNDCADVDLEYQEACKRNIFDVLHSNHQNTCLTAFFYFGRNVDKPDLPNVSINTSQDEVDNALEALETWARYAFYLGEQVIFRNVLHIPYMFCRLRYYSSFIYGEISDSGVIVYPHDHTDYYTGKEYKKGDPITIEPNDVDDYDRLKCIGGNRNFKRDRQSCYKTLNNKGFKNNMSEKQLFDKLYRLKGVYSQKNDKVIGQYCRHAIRVIGLKNGTLDPAIYCTMKNLSEAFAESKRLSRLVIPGSSGDTEQNPIIVNE